MKEQDAAHSFEVNDDFKIRNYGAIQNKLLSANAELTRLRSELQQERELRKELVEALELTVQEIKPLRIKNSMRIMELEFLIKKAK